MQNSDASEFPKSPNAEIRTPNSQLGCFELSVASWMLSVLRFVVVELSVGRGAFKTIIRVQFL